MRRNKIVIHSQDNRALRSAESGNVFLFILIGIVLFAAITFVMSSSMRSEGTAKLSDRRAGLLAAEIMSYAQQLQRGIDRLRNNNCSESEINIQRDWNNNGSVTDTAADNYNANAPADDSCDLFSTAGANISFKSWEGVNNFRISGSNRIEGIGCNGTDRCADLVFAIIDIDQILCEALNSKLNISAIPQDGNGASGLANFTGAYTPTPPIIGDEDVNLAGKDSACYFDTSGEVYIFYKVLLAR